MSWAVETSALRRVFAASRQTGRSGAGPAGKGKPVEALAGVDLHIRTGELYGLLGPNGAGKTTLLKILTTLLYPTAGAARVAGFDVVRQAGEVRKRIALVSGGEYSGYGILNVRETLWMFGQFYGVPTKEARRRAQILLATVGLTDLAEARVNRLSTGQRQRLNFARGFMSDPDIAFLDEPTLGLDVNAARDLRGFIRRWLAEKPSRTVVLTTHYLLEVGEVDGLGEALAVLPGLSSLRAVAQPDKGTTLWHFQLGEGQRISHVLELLSWRGIVPVNLTTHDPSLEDVFVAIVGRGLDDATPGEE